MSHSRFERSHLFPREEFLASQNNLEDQMAPDLASESTSSSQEISSSSNRFRNLPNLHHPRLLIHKLSPANRHHLIPRLANSHDDAQLVLRCAAEIAPLVSQTDYNRPYNISHAKALRDFYLVDLRRADVLLSDERGKDVAAGMLAGGAEGEDREGRLAGVGARDATQDDCAGFGNEGASGAGDGESGLGCGFCCRWLGAQGACEGGVDVRGLDVRSCAGVVG